MTASLSYVTYLVDLGEEVSVLPAMLENMNLKILYCQCYSNKICARVSVR